MVAYGVFCIVRSFHLKIRVRSSSKQTGGISGQLSDTSFFSTFSVEAAPKEPAQHDADLLLLASADLMNFLNKRTRRSEEHGVKLIAQRSPLSRDYTLTSHYCLSLLQADLIAVSLFEEATWTPTQFPWRALHPPN